MAWRECGGLFRWRATLAAWFSCDGGWGGLRQWTIGNDELLRLTMRASYSTGARYVRQSADQSRVFSHQLCLALRSGGGNAMSRPLLNLIGQDS